MRDKESVCGSEGVDMHQMNNSTDYIDAAIPKH